MAVVSSCFDMYNLVYITNAILFNNINYIKILYNLLNFLNKLKSSPYDLSNLGHTRITKIKTKKFNKVIWRNF